ncbi:MAG TPA: bifunctional 5,10-methylenetetrahydrofolate dehydrogenase/5,10-methenyltetrahydrofolate cyclohydrolase [Thermoplasmatales archaeon]|nr:MAG: bifunctional methylenetetrahydrofolate dehydrogenase/methenyltetrahydrofolate cyclohydrolase [Thermoplasmata archaeon]HDN51301.1 bifunctional 5,10-methylenetetrahydrofolate dehydrogenase/5,10-methenyltetrahydrofolate cyclohydrolase [Thermoplasmatales archaeon]
MHAIDGRKIARTIEERVKKQVEGKSLKLVTIVVQGSEESWLFARLKDRACRKVGIHHEILGLDTEKQEPIEQEIEKLNRDESVTGIHIQLPLPETIRYTELVGKVALQKDVEGMHPRNLGAIMLGRERIIPCTPKAVLTILHHETIPLKGKNVVIVNHSTIVGKPLALLMLNRDATVSVCHVYTKNLASCTKQADILVTATGVRGLITGEHVREGCILIDAGIKEENGAVYGDADESARMKAGAFTPVPGGVGPVTIACMLENVVEAYKNIHKGP